MDAQYPEPANRGGTLSGQSVGHQGRFAPSLWSVNQTYDVSIDGKPFRFRIVEIGQVDERGDKRAYCDIEVEAIADTPGQP